MVVLRVAAGASGSKGRHQALQRADPRGSTPASSPTPSPRTQQADPRGSAPASSPNPVHAPNRGGDALGARGDGAELSPSVATGRQSRGSSCIPGSQGDVLREVAARRRFLLLPHLSRGTGGRQRDGRLSGGSPSRREPSWLCRGSLFLYGNEEFRLMELNHL